ncbi:hypothetical protein STRTUCAR8_08492, partial [Streptomyces turgidiscabies Car8]
MADQARRSAVAVLESGSPLDRHRRCVG